MTELTKSINDEVTPSDESTSTTRADPPKREGDWDCPECRYPNFAFRRTCKACGVLKPGASEVQVNPADIQNMRPGDWLCISCANHNFAYRKDVTAVAPHDSPLATSNNPSVPGTGPAPPVTTTTSPPVRAVTVAMPPVGIPPAVSPPQATLPPPLPPPPPLPAPTGRTTTPRRTTTAAGTPRG
eukprot:CAMPEP_0201493018 /NCGR_PEP_ID=MMETSP0151_2-20130828/35775_1 /ASSEMBLY_ACC=CAM_ASM_000257 /TAXON_ID=200890 /ORGANISM="Paramoeba atlantica, Strain 621/1 / CCAP 1560/9" /LENGTH=183 /DNA_ID=CAMNT_0047880143 /DNA_START=50 /DNA_END=598 /DNA_ORIENTATION=-